MGLNRSLDAQRERARAKLALLEEKAIMRDCNEYQWLKGVARRLRKRHAALQLADGVDALAGIVADQERKEKLQRAGITQHELTDAEAVDTGD